MFLFMVVNSAPANLFAIKPNFLALMGYHYFLSYGVSFILIGFNFYCT